MTKKRTRKKRKLDAVSFTDDDMSILYEAIEGDVSPEGHVIRVILHTGMRVGDVLRLSKADIKRGLRTGVLQATTKGDMTTPIPIAGATEVWRQLYEEMRGGRNVAWWVCPDGDGSCKAGACAYQRVNRKFKALGKKLGIEGRIHLHRLRRAFAVAALREEGDIMAVKQALGHRSITSTQYYLDELRVDDVASTQQAVQNRWRKKGNDENK